MLKCAHCSNEIDYDDAKMCPECEGPLCKADCSNKGTCMDYLKKNGRAADNACGTFCSHEHCGDA